MFLATLNHGQVKVSQELKTSLSPAQLDKMADEQIPQLHHHKLHLKDIPKIIKSNLESLTGMGISESGELINSTMHIVDRIIDHTDSTRHFDFISDPIYKTFARTFCNILIFEKINPFPPELVHFQSTPSEEEIEEWANNFLCDFKDGFQVSDLSLATHKAIYIARQFGHLNSHEQLDLAKKFIKQVIEQTPHYAFSSHVIFKEFILPFLSLILGV